jgi:hypothetical protein
MMEELNSKSVFEEIGITAAINEMAWKKLGKLDAVKLSPNL